MFALRRSLLSAGRIARPQVARFSSASVLLQHKAVKTAEKLSEVTGPESLIGTSAAPGTVPTDLEQETGLARLELLGKMDGIDIFDLGPVIRPQHSVKGTPDDPIWVPTYDSSRIVGCSGTPHGSHEVQWFHAGVEKVGRCDECGAVYRAYELGADEEAPHH
ncbi:Cytochrome c oxidase subunit 4 [Yarrowia sp. C11]|nr:Cytochrome c oxidase subunit 4 [Yarrowia sp. C11]KAG5370606.1 Cytochrome c oxidase subunit 4 [Yarrowia sp. E02]